MKIRRDGFSFEYSATFGQAVAGKNVAVKVRQIENEFLEKMFEEP